MGRSLQLHLGAERYKYYGDLAVGTTIRELKPGTNHRECIPRKGLCGGLAPSKGSCPRSRRGDQRHAPGAPRPGGGRLGCRSGGAMIGLSPAWGQQWSERCQAPLSRLSAPPPTRHAPSHGGPDRPHRGSDHEARLTWDLSTYPRLLLSHCLISHSRTHLGKMRCAWAVIESR